MIPLSTSDDANKLDGFHSKLQLQPVAHDPVRMCCRDEGGGQAVEPVRDLPAPVGFPWTHYTPVVATLRKAAKQKLDVLGRAGTIPDTALKAMRWGPAALSASMWAPAVRYGKDLPLGFTVGGLLQTVCFKLRQSQHDCMQGPCATLER